ncbi:MAG: murein transglycosylase A [Pseudomonadota bacterium]
MIPIFSQNAARPGRLGALAALFFFAASLILLVLSVYAVVPTLSAGPGTRSAVDETPAYFDFEVLAPADVPGWTDANTLEAIDTFLRSCAAHANRSDDTPANPVAAVGPLAKARIGDAEFSGTLAHWRPACRAAATLNSNVSPAVARSFFEDHFVFVRILTRPEPSAPAHETGLLTGYFEPVYAASDQPTEAFSAPVYARPIDLVDIDLGRFREDLAGTRLAGRLSGSRLMPFESRAEINDGALLETTAVLAWLNPDDAFFLQIQGSGVLKFADGRIMRVGYAGQNGHPYTAIGKPLIERGILTRETVSLQSIRDWLANADPASARALREENASFVFFRILDTLPDPSLGPLGAQGVQLTPSVSLAVDRRYHAMGTPIWVSYDHAPDGTDGAGESVRRLMIAQDTGGAIRGPVRGDVFWGRGPAAKVAAGTMRAQTSFIALIPRPAVAAWGAGP